MPSSMVHLLVAHSVKDAFSISDIGKFYLGCVAPDAVNLDGKASKEVRYKAHLRDTDYQKWINNVAVYKEEHSELLSVCYDYFCGYLVHILTDIAWDLTAQPLLFKKMSDKGIADNELNTKKWNELSFYDSVSAKTDVWKNEIRPLLKDAKEDCSLTVSADDADRCRDLIVSESFAASDNKSFGLVTDDMVTEAAKNVLELSKKIELL